jgi:uncharacterized membrane protein YphA (DoxX/SURF4 family)
MWRIFFGAALVVAGIAAFIEAHSHRPTHTCSEGREECFHLVSSGLSQTPYDLLRIGAWALLILGGLLVIVGLIRYWAVQRTQPDSQDS